MFINDSLLSLTERERKYFMNSWVETLNKKIFLSRVKDLNTKIKRVIKDGLKSYSPYRKDKEISNTEEFKLLTRTLKE